MTLTKFKQADKALDKLGRSYERQLIRNYQLALKEIRGQIAEAYAKLPEASFVEIQKYNRLANLEKGISKEIAALTSKNAVTLKRGMGDMYAESFYRTGFTLETTVQAKLGFGMLDPKVIERSIQNPLDRVGFLARNRDNQARLTRQLKENLTQGLIQGESYQQTAKRIKERMDVGATNTLRIARTENHRVQNLARLDGLEQADSVGVIMKKQWVSTLDSETRDTHQDLDGQKVDLDAEFEIDGLTAQYPGGFGVAEEDINCRCSHIGVIEGYEPTFRRARGEGVIPYANYNSWKKERIG